MTFTCRPADPDSLKKIWQKNIDRNPGDDRWLRWRDEYLRINAEGLGRTFIIFADDEPVGEGTLLFAPSCSAISGRTILADGKTVTNLNALRIHQDYEGQGHISRLVKMMEAHARSLGYTAITIGVEEKEARNRAIYEHWGYTNLILTEVEADLEEERVLYYEKPLRGEDAQGLCP